MRKAIQIICVLLACFMFVLPLSSCGGSSEDMTEKMSEEEMLELSKLAEEYLHNGKFAEEVKTYQKLYDGGCTDAKYFDYPDKTVEEALDLIKEAAKKRSTVCRLLSYAIRHLKEKLKDPYSLVVYKVNVKVKGSDSISFEIDYGAKNGFGGMVRNNYNDFFITFSEDEINTLFQDFKSQSDNRNATIDAVADYLACYTLTFDEGIYKAIVDGTVTYYK